MSLTFFLRRFRRSLFSREIKVLTRSFPFNFPASPNNDYDHFPFPNYLFEAPPFPL